MTSGSVGNQVVCAWCSKVLKEGAEPTSHGMCAQCASDMFSLNQKGYAYNTTLWFTDPQGYYNRIRAMNLADALVRARALSTMGYTPHMVEAKGRVYSMSWEHDTLYFKECTTMGVRPCELN